jgi:DNA mismatch repair ATPase MutS
MKVRLLYGDRDADLGGPPPSHADDLRRDLELTTVFDAMARGDRFLRPLVEEVVLASLVDPGEIRYRQDVLRDCLEQPATVRALYALAIAGLETKKRAYLFWALDSPDALMSKSLRILELLAEVLRRLRAFADEHAAGFVSEGFTRLFATLRHELDDVYLSELDGHLRELSFRRGALISAELGRANRGTRYALRRPNERGFLERVTSGRRTTYSFSVPARDENGAKALADVRGRGIRFAANALAQSSDHILAFFALLRAELGFYVGCLNLHEQLLERGGPACFPEPAPVGLRRLRARGLYDAALSFHLGSRVVGNDIEADGKRLIVITGANQGGKSTLLRSAGLAQLLMQAGMFVPAELFEASVARGVFTHFRREEDETMTRGKLDEELSRMSAIADVITPGCLLLCNESFASTNEREGAEIARQVIHALLEAGVDVAYVTHLYDLADGLCRERLPAALFLRAERLPDGRRTFRLSPGEPLPTSYGLDSYRRVFGADRKPPGTVGRVGSLQRDEPPAEPPGQG